MQKIKYLLSLIGILCFSMLLLSGCGTKTATEQKTAPQGEVKIVTSFYPVYIAALNVTKGIDDVSVVNMTKAQTGCLHDYQLTTEDLKTLEKADFFIVNGAGMESFLEKVIKQQKNLRILEASEGIELLKDGDAVNPHVWVSVSAAIRQVQNIADQLALADAEHAAQYKENGAAYIKKLEILKQEMHREVDKLPNKDIVTFHEAFPYFAREFGLRVAAVIEREPGSEPSPKELEETVEKIKTRQVKALFVEPQYPARAAETIAKESGAKVYTLDPVVTGEANAEALDAYLQAMRKNARVLQEALQ